MKLIEGLLVAAMLSASLFAQGSGEVALRAAIETETVKGDIKDALRQYAEIAAKYAKSDRATAASALIHQAECHQKLGDQEARAIFERVVREYPDQRDQAAQARKRLSTISAGAPRLLAANQVWAGTDVDPWASLAEDGRILATSAPGGIRLRGMDGGQSKFLPLKTGFAEFPILSPDRKLLAFGWANPERYFDYDLLIMGTEPGAAARTLISNPSFDYYIPHGWSEDEKSVLVSMSEQSSNRLAWVNVASGYMTQLRTFPWATASGIKLSPDRRLIAYQTQSGQDSPAEIHLLSSDGSTDRAVVTGAGHIGSLVWTEDGSKLVFTSDRSGSEGLWWVGIRDGGATGSPELLKAQTGKMILKGFLRDGSLLYLQSHRGQDLYRVPLGTPGSQKTASKSLLTESYRGSNSRPSWSPDASQIAYISYREDPDVDGLRFVGALVLRSLSSGRERIVGGPLPNPSTPMWMPTGDKILITARNRRNSTCVYQIEVASGKTTELFDLGSASAPIATLSADGKTVYTLDGGVTAYTLDTGARRRLIEGTRRLLTMSSDGSRLAMRLLTMSPDGSRLAMVLETGNGTRGRTSRLVTVRPDGSDLRVLLTEPTGQPRPTALTWSAESHTIYFARPQRDSMKPEATLWSISADAGAPLFTGLSADYINSIAVSPDGGELVYGGGPLVAYEYWMLANLKSSFAARRD